MELQYERAWQDSELGRPLSLSLPFNMHGEPIKGDSVANYFDNLLPDSTDIRNRVALRFKTGSLEPFDLLRAIGRDCAGASVPSWPHKSSSGCCARPMVTPKTSPSSCWQAPRADFTLSTGVLGLSTPAN